MKAQDIELPDYTPTQELWNSISHGAGTVLTLIFGPFLIIKAAKSGDVWSIVACSIFVFALLCLYTFSCLYHGLHKNIGKKVLRVMDHDMVFVLIMGTYAPYSLISLRQFSQGWCWGIFGPCILLGIIGIVLNSCDLKKFAIFSMIDYILMGWIIVISMYPLSLSMKGFFPGVFLLLMGGISYTVGAVLYGVGKKRSPWWHTVFHVFVLIGTILMFISIFYNVLP
ncbi:MAG: hemolysin III family protein [Bacilli bacterium]